MANEQSSDIMTPNVVAEEYAEFSSVFDSLMDKGTLSDEQNTETDPPNGTNVPADDAGKQTEPPDGAGDSVQPPAPAGDGAVQDGQGAQDDQGGQPAGGDQGTPNVDWEARFRELESRIGQTQQPAPTPAPQQEAPSTPAIYTAEEQTELAELQQNWPDLNRMFSLMARQLQVDTLNYAFSEVGKVITPLQESVSAYSTNDHLAAIYEEHEDYDQVYQPVMEWIDKQPSFLKTAYLGVVKQGTAGDVSAMIQRFKDETKWAAPAGQQGVGASRPAGSQGAAPAPSQPQTGLSEAAKKAAKAMGAVGTKRGAGANAQDPSDFDGAWQEAIGS